MTVMSLIAITQISRLVTPFLDVRAPATCAIVVGRSASACTVLYLYDVPKANVHLLMCALFRPLMFRKHKSERTHCW